MSRVIFALILIVSACSSAETESTYLPDPEGFSQRYLAASKNNGDTRLFQDTLRNVSAADLSASLTSDAVKKSFWLNIYNASIQELLKGNEGVFADRDQFFKSNQIGLAGKEVSLDFIEHQILRKQSSDSDLAKDFAVDTIDYRIHFALNCGAKSCPPIAFYESAFIDDQLDQATRSYLSSEVTYQPLINSVEVPRLMDWFSSDFGGKKGILRILKELKLIPELNNPAITFSEYDWTLNLNNFKSDESS